MPIIAEAQLKSDIKSGKFAKVYFFYGEENFLTQMYADQIKNTVLKKGDDDINLVKTYGNPDLTFLTDQASSLPFFADKRVILINDFSIEKIPDNEVDDFINFIKNVPDTTILVFYLTDCSFSLRFSKVKKVFSAFKEFGAVCEFKPLKKEKIAELIVKKAAKQKRFISRKNAEYLAEITACDLNLASSETTKLCSYARENEEITKRDIDLMVAKKLETKVFALADAVIEKNTERSFAILNELFEQRADALQILPTLGSAYSEYYYSKAAYDENISCDKLAEDLGISGARATFFRKKYRAASKMDASILRNAVKIIYDADIKCKSANIDKNILMEETILELIKGDKL